MMRQFRQQALNTKSFSPYLYVDSGTPSKIDNSFQRYLHFSPQFEHQKTCEQFSQLFERIQHHMEATSGRIEGAGYIRRYFFVFDKGAALEITPAGRIIATHEDFDANNIYEFSKERVA